jgi:hypothetical protein
MNQEQKIIQIEENIIQRQKEIENARQLEMKQKCESLEKDADEIMDKLEEDILNSIVNNRLRHKGYSNNISYFLDRYEMKYWCNHLNNYTILKFSEKTLNYMAPEILKNHKNKYKVLSYQCVNLLSKHYRNYLISELAKRNLTIYFGDKSIFSTYFSQFNMYIVDPEFIKQAEIRKQNKRCIIL